MRRCTWLGAVLQKLAGNTISVKPHFLFSLGCHSEQAGDEGSLPGDISFGKRFSTAGKGKRSSMLLSARGRKRLTRGTTADSSARAESFRRYLVSQLGKFLQDRGEHCAHQYHYKEEIHESQSH